MSAILRNCSDHSIARSAQMISLPVAPRRSISSTMSALSSGRGRGGAGRRRLKMPNMLMSSLAMSRQLCIGRAAGNDHLDPDDVWIVVAREVGDAVFVELNGLGLLLALDVLCQQRTFSHMAATLGGRNSA